MNKKKKVSFSKGRHTPDMPPFIVVLAATLLGAGAVTGLFFIVLARLKVPTFGWIPRSGSLVGQDVFALVRGATTITGILAGVFAVVYAYRKQRIEEASSTRADDEGLSKRYQDGARQLGDMSAAVRLAGVYALARLADEDQDHRSTIVNVLCSYLRLPYDIEDAPRGEREVRFAIIEAVRVRLTNTESETSWAGYDFDFRGAVFDGGSFKGANFISGEFNFEGARFIKGETSFENVAFSGAEVSFGDGTGAPARFEGGSVSFIGSHFTGGHVTFITAQFVGAEVNFGAAVISENGYISFSAADFRGGILSFGDGIWRGAELAGGQLVFSAAWLYGGTLLFCNTQFQGTEVKFEGVRFAGSELIFYECTFEGGCLDFKNAEMQSGQLKIIDAHPKLENNKYISNWPLENSKVVWKVNNRNTININLRLLAHVFKIARGKR